VVTLPIGSGSVNSRKALPPILSTPFNVVLWGEKLYHFTGACSGKYAQLFSGALGMNSAVDSQLS
jgi:hypothetical protein